jgi:hypothetical protein
LQVGDDAILAGVHLTVGEVELGLGQVIASLAQQQVVVTVQTAVHLGLSHAGLAGQQVGLGGAKCAVGVVFLLLARLDEVQRLVQALLEALERTLPGLGYRGPAMAFVGYWLSHDSNVNEPVLDVVRRDSSNEAKVSSGTTSAMATRPPKQ